MTVERILSHMNKDHSHNLEDYLVVISKVSPKLASQSPVLTSLTIDCFTIEYAHKQSANIPFTPPLADLSEAKARLIELANECASARGYSAHRITKVPTPKTKQDAFVYTTILSSVAFAIRPSLLSTIGLGGSNLKYWIGPAVGFVMAVHAIEAVILGKMLIKYRVPTLEKIKAFAFISVEGVFMLKKIKAIAQKFTPVKNE